MENNKLETISNLFEDNEIRSVWDNDKEEYYFSVVDVISALTNSNIPRNKLELSKINALNVSTKVFGMVDKIPAIIRRDIPFPNPFCVIWSPNHNRKAVPAVNITVILK